MSKARPKKTGSRAIPTGTPFTDLIKKLYQEPHGSEDLWLKVVGVFQAYSGGLTDEHVRIFLQGAVCGCSCCIDEEIAEEAGPTRRRRPRVRRHEHAGEGGAPGAIASGGPPGGDPYRAWPMSQYPSF